MSDCTEKAVVRKRRIEVSVGVPEMLEGFPMDKQPDMPHHDECYFLNFVDTPDPDNVGQNGFVAQSLCLCSLAEASAAWLQGANEEEVKDILDDGHRSEHRPEDEDES